MYNSEGFSLESWYFLLRNKVALLLVSLFFFVGISPSVAVAATTCSAINKQYPFGIAASKFYKNNGGSLAGTPVVRASVYKKYAFLDKDRDRIVCEKEQTSTAKPGNTNSSSKIESNFELWAKKNIGKKENHFVFRNTDVQDQIFNIINSSEVKAANLFANYIKKDTYSFISIDDQWFFEKGRSHGILVPPNNGSIICFNAPTSIAPCSNLLQSSFYNLPKETVNINNHIYALGAHEYFHLVQSELANLSPSVPRTIPEWFSEGSAEFVGYATFALASGRTYESVTSNFTKSKDLESDPYVAGRVAIEYLVKEYGFESILNTFRDYSVDNNFDTIFKKNFGISIEDLRSKL